MTGALFAEKACEVTSSNVRRRLASWIGSSRQDYSQVVPQ